MKKDALLETLILEGVMGDATAQRLAVDRDREVNCENMTPICLQWMHDMAAAGDEVMRFNYIDEVVLGNYENVDWMEVEAWAHEVAKASPRDGYYMLGMLYHPYIGHLKNAAKMEQNMRLAIKNGNRVAAMCLAQYYFHSKSGQHDLREIRDLLEFGVQDRHIPNRFGLMIEVCDAMGDEEASMRYLKRWFKEDDKNLTVCMQMAFRYLRGTGIRENAELALRYFEKAAYRWNNEDAMYYVGVLNYEGKGCKKNLKRAVDYFKRAVDAGSGEACFALGTMHDEGHDLPQDEEKVVAYLSLGAERREPRCCLALARLSFNGEYMEKDVQRAHELLNVVREQMDILDETIAEWFYEVEREVLFDSLSFENEVVTPPSDAEVQEAVRENDFKALILNVYKCLYKCPMAENVLKTAWFLMRIRALKEDERYDFINILRLQADECPQVALMVGDMYYEGVGAIRNKRSAMMFYRKALDTDYAEHAYLRIIMGLHEEELVGGREAVSVWLEPLCRLFPDSPCVLYLRALLHHVGLYVERDEEKANNLYNQAVALGWMRDMKEDIKYWQVGRDCLRDLLDLPPAHEIPEKKRHEPSGA